MKYLYQYHSLKISLFASCDARLELNMSTIYSNYDIPRQKSDGGLNTHPEKTWMTFSETFVCSIEILLSLEGIVS